MWGMCAFLGVQRREKSRRVILFVLLCVIVLLCECDCECTTISNWMKVWLSFRWHLCWASWHLSSGFISSRTSVLPSVTQDFYQFYWILRLSYKHSILAPIAGKLDLLVWCIKLLSWSQHDGTNAAGLTCPGEGDPTSPRHPEGACDGGWASGGFHSSFFMSLVLKSMFSQNTNAVRMYHICIDKKKLVYWHFIEIISYTWYPFY